MSGSTFPTPGKTYEVWYSDADMKLCWKFVLPKKTSGTLTCYFSLMMNAAISLTDLSIKTSSSTDTYKTIKWVID